MISVGCGSAIGALIRYLITFYWQKQKINWPLATLFINVTGSFILAALTTHTGGQSPAMLLLGVGMMGGYTTFSTFNTELVAMIDEKRWGALFAYLGLSYVLGIAAGVLGIML